MNQAQAIKALYMTASIAELEAEKERRKGDKVAVQTLQLMIDACKNANVDNYGELPL